MEASHTDDMIMLKDTKFPLSSMSLFALIGSTGSGKTFQAFKIQNEYNRVSKEKYDFENPYDILYKPFTHQYYISGTSVKVDHPYIYKDCEVMQEVLQKIILMSDDFDDVAFAQKVLMNLNGEEPADQIRHFIDLIELMKMAYPELKEKYHNPVITGIYKIFNMQYDGYFIRRPKISIILDDSSGMKLWQGTAGNYFYRFLTRRRHYGVYNCIICTHSITVLFGNYREVFSAYLLFRDINLEHVKMLYNQSLGMEKRDFSWQNFLKLYQEQCGFNDSIYDSEQNIKKQHNFLYVLRQPIKSIYLNFEDKIF